MKNLSIFTAATMLAVAAMATMTGCEEADKLSGDLEKQCGLECNTNALAEGQVTISGVPNIDAFFNQVANFNATANIVATGLDSPIANIKAQLKLPATATGAEVVAAMKTQFALEGSLKVAYAPPSCQVSAKATVDAAAKCDVDVDPGSIKAKCSARCEADVVVNPGQVSCTGTAKAKCTAPKLDVACSGSCKGTCGVEVAAACSGTCKGTCSGTCAATDASGKCAGKCEGTCTGTCEAEVVGTCSGKCTGDCSIDYDPATCTADAKIECFAEPPTAGGTIECEGSCEGSVEPPEVKAECKASAKAEAELKAECTPPSIEFDAALSATATADQKIRYAAFLEVFQTEMGVLVANLKRSDVVLKAGANVIGSVDGVGQAFAAAIPQASGNLKVAFGLKCAAQVLPTVGKAMGDSTKKLGDSASAAAGFVAAFK